MIRSSFRHLHANPKAPPPLKTTYVFWKSIWLRSSGSPVEIHLHGTGHIQPRLQSVMDTHCHCRFTILSALLLVSIRGLFLPLFLQFCWRAYPLSAARQGMLSGWAAVILFMLSMPVIIRCFTEQKFLCSCSYIAFSFFVPALACFFGGVFQIAAGF